MIMTNVYCYLFQIIITLIQINKLYSAYVILFNFFLNILISVQHILGSLFHKYTVVWDLRKNEPIIKLSDSNSKVPIYTKYIYVF